MTSKPYLLFDAGGTLVFPEHTVTAKLASETGLEVSAQELAKAHARLFRDFDQQIADKHHFPPIEYYPDLFKLVSDDHHKAQVAAKRVKEYDQQRSLWMESPLWVRESLEQLRQQGYQMSVISNSDGRVEAILSELGLRDFFEIVIDSQIVGVEKPEQKIFNLALDELNLKPENALYIGDIYFVDVWGANQSQIAAVHLDLMNFYSDWPGARIPSIQHLPDWLAQLNGNLHNENLFPARDLRFN